MNEENYIIQHLLEKYANGKISKEEYDKLLWYINEYDTLEDVELFMDKDWKSLEGYPLPRSKSEDIFQGIVEDTQSVPLHRNKASIIKLWRWGAAAAIVLIIGGLKMYDLNETGLKPERELIQKHEIISGGNKATITLANGDKIALSENQSGIVIGNELVTYNDGTSLDVNASILQKPSKPMIQTIATPRGGTYQVTLSDGTKVWLNAASSLTYSTHMGTSKTRHVKLDGEAYFEVAKDKRKPFIVESKNQTVEVLGTHFNVSSYSDEMSSRTTLLEGSVKVNNTLLKPDQQAVLQGDKIHILDVNAERMVAWKNGKFIFKSESLESIMLKLSRWYDVEVVYEGNFNDKVFTGAIGRNDDISKILAKISFTKAAKFKIEGRRVVVMP